MKLLLSILLSFVVTTLISQNELPVISNLTVQDNGGSFTITYDLADNENDDCIISLSAKLPNGNIQIAIPEQTTGDINSPVSVGTGKTIIWDYSEFSGSGDYTIKLTADDQYEIDIQEIVNQVDSTLLYSDLEFIEGIRHRTAGVDHLNVVRDYIDQKFNDAGLIMNNQEFDYGSFVGENFIGDIKGTSDENSIYILCGHYDTVDNSPGADDNGSAVVGMLEALRILAPYNFKKTIRFIGFDLEEPGLKGSEDYVTNGENDFETINGVLDFEMIGYATEEENTQSFPFGFNALFPDVYNEIQADGFRGNFILNVGTINQNQWELAYVNAAVEYVPELKIQTIIAPENWLTITPDLGRSDHAPFWLAGTPAVMLSGTANFRNDNYHTPNDTLETLNFTFMANVVKAAVATLAEEAEIEHSTFETAIINLDVSINENILEKISIYPNPAKEYIVIDTKEFIERIEIFNVLGELVYLVFEPKTQIDVSKLVKGQYSIRVKFTDSDFQKTIIID